MVLYTNIAKGLGIIVALLGAVVILGWVLGIPELTSILPQWVTMKFTTALAFLLSGILLSICTVCKDRVGFGSFLTLSVGSLILFGLVLLLFFSALFGFGAGVENIFIPEAEGAVESVEPGLPSLGTLIAFLLMSLIGIGSAMELRSLKVWYGIAGGVMVLFGILATTGYIVDVPVLYFRIEGISTAMAIHTALAFVLLGVGLLLLMKTNMKKVSDTTNTPQTIT